MQTERHKVSPLLFLWAQDFPALPDPVVSLGTSSLHTDNLATAATPASSLQPGSTYIYTPSMYVHTHTPYTFTQPLAHACCAASFSAAPLGCTSEDTSLFGGGATGPDCLPLSNSSRREFSATSSVEPSCSVTASHSGKKPATVGTVANTTDTTASARFCRHTTCKQQHVSACRARLPLLCVVLPALQLCPLATGFVLQTRLAFGAACPVHSHNKAHPLTIVPAPNQMSRSARGG